MFEFDDNNGNYYTERQRKNYDSYENGGNTVLSSRKSPNGVSSNYLENQKLAKMQKFPTEKNSRYKLTNDQLSPISHPSGEFFPDDHR